MLFSSKFGLSTVSPDWHDTETRGRTISLSSTDFNQFFVKLNTDLKFNKPYLSHKQH